MALRTPIEQTGDLNFMTFTCIQWWRTKIVYSPVDFKHSLARHYIEGDEGE